ncbi:MAG: hypothetical protein KUG62_03020, partial [Rhodobacteraceae bacterium]|nr:hypothetical protein [Paracoccaceae bacterium]
MVPNKIPATQHTTLQSLIWPEQDICTERDLYVHLHGPAGVSEKKGAIYFAAGGEAQFNTYFNLFNFGKWQKHCDLKDIWLALSGRGQFEITTFAAFADRSWERVLNDVIDLTDEQAPMRFDLSQITGTDRPCLLYFELKALSQGRITQADWQTTQSPRRTPELALS